MRGSGRNRIVPRAFLAAAIVAVSAAVAPAEVPLEGGTWSFSWVIRSKTCTGESCWTDVKPERATSIRTIRPGRVPTVGPILPCTRCEAEARSFVQLVRYVASRTRPRQFRLAMDRPTVVALFQDYLPGFRVTRWSSIVKVSADGQRIRQRDAFWYAYDTDDVRQRFRVTFHVRGQRTADAATSGAEGS